MAPSDLRDSTEANGSIRPTGKGKGKQKLSRNLSNASLGDLTPEAVDGAIAAVDKISKILFFVQGYREEISDVEGIYRLGIRQQGQIDELETTVTNLAFRRDKEIERLRDENETYRAEAHQYELDREELKRKQSSIDDTLKLMQSNMENEKKMEIDEAKKGFSDRFKTKAKQIKEDYEKRIQGLETDNAGLRDAIENVEKEKTQAQEDLNQQKERFDIDKRSFQSHIKHIESELDQISAASMASPQTAEFYIEGFRQLWEAIQDVAANDLRFLPEDTEPLDSDTTRDRLLSASAIFKYPPLSTESPVATFLRACAIQNFLSTKTVSIIKRRYFAESAAAVERKSGSQPTDSILDTISNVPAVTSSQELTWQLTTVDKLDRLGSGKVSAPTIISTRPSQDKTVDEFLDLLQYFRSPTDRQLRAKLTEITNTAINLWRALRKDSCRVDFDYDPSTGGWQECEFVDDAAMNGSIAANLPSNIPVDQLPLKSFMLFPRITGYFGPDYDRRRILHEGLALPHESSAFQKGLQEIKDIHHKTNEFKRSLRRGSSAQSSPITGKRQGDWPAHRGYN